MQGLTQAPVQEFQASTNQESCDMDGKGHALLTQARTEPICLPYITHPICWAPRGKPCSRVEFLT